jgi:hypothetical protein
MSELKVSMSFLTTAMLTGWLMLTLDVSAAEMGSPKETWESYKSALRIGDAETCFSLISKNSIDACEEIRKWSLKLSREELEKLDEMDVAIVLVYRLEFDLEKLKKLSIEELMSEMFVKNARDGYKFFNLCTLDDFEIEGNTAIANLHSKFSTQDLKVRFVNEKETWKFDVDHFGKQSQSWYGPARSKSGLSKVDFALALLKKQCGEDNVPTKIVDAPFE